MHGSPYYKPYWLNDDELEHYGVKGMRWGVRKDEKPTGNGTSARSSQANKTTQTRAGSENRTAGALKGSSRSSTPHLDNRGDGVASRSRTNRQSATYNRALNSASKSLGSGVSSSSNGSFRITPNASGYTVSGASGGYPLEYNLSPEDLEELIEEGAGEKYGNTAGTFAFSTSELKEAKAQRDQLEKIATAVENAQKTISNLGASVMQKGVSKIQSSTLAKKANTLQSSIAKTLAQNIAAATSLPKKKAVAAKR